MGCERIYSDQTLTLGVHSLSMGQGSKVLPYVCSGLRGFGVLAVNHLVGGSSPSRGANKFKDLFRLNHLVNISESALSQRGFIGSSETGSSIKGRRNQTFENFPSLPHTYISTDARYLPSR